MPYILIRSNTDLASQAQQALLSRSSRLVAEALGKPEHYVMVSLDLGTPMLFAGENSPCAYLELKSIGLPEGETVSLSQQLSQFIGDELNIPLERIYIEFSGAARHMWGWKGGTF